MLTSRLREPSRPWRQPLVRPFCSLSSLCLFVFRAGLPAVRGTQLFPGLRERRLAFPEETLLQVASPMKHLDSLSPSFSSHAFWHCQAPSRVLCSLLYYLGLGKCLYFRMSQKYILCKVQKSGVFSFRWRLGDSGLGAVRGQERS